MTESGMNENYRAPASWSAGAPAATASLPRSIAFAIAFIVLRVLIDCQRQVSTVGAIERGEMTGLLWGFRWVSIAALVAIAWSIRRRYGSARWLLLVVTAWGALGFGLDLLAYANLPEGVHLRPDFAAAGREIARVLCLVIAVVLAFGPGRRWFAREGG
jgi:hypothetical protein